MANLANLWVRRCGIVEHFSIVVNLYPAIVLFSDSKLNKISAVLEQSILKL